MSDGTAARERLGWVILRVLVPAWLATGAVFKLLENTPSSLPEPVIKIAGSLGLDLSFVLHYSVAVELVVAGVILFLPRLARAAAILLLGFFAVILVWETVSGAASCGCFGSVTVPPWVTLVVDGSLFLGVLFLAPRGREFAPPTPLRTAIALLWTLAVFAVSFAAAPRPENGGGAAVQEGGMRAAMAPVPPSYYLPDYDSWIGKTWDELDLSPYLGPEPSFLRHGLAFVVFYRKDCEHCHQLFSTYFAGEPPYPTLLVAVPEKNGFPTTGVLPLPCTGCAERDLPAGCDWFFQTPVVVRFEDGRVTCVAEEDPNSPRCIDW